MAEAPALQRVRVLVEPIISDLQLDLYDIEMRGGTLQIQIDTPPGSDTGVDLATITLASRLILAELDHNDPIPGNYQLEVTSPGLERTLRTPAHFQREVGKTVTVRVANTDAEHRRVQGELIAADESTATIRTDDGERVIRIDDIDKARTVFEWGPQPKPGKSPNNKTKRGARASSNNNNNNTTTTTTPTASAPNDADDTADDTTSDKASDKAPADGATVPTGEASSPERAR